MGLSQPKRLNYLNFAKVVQDLPPVNLSTKHSPFQVLIGLSNNVTLEKRDVYDIFMMFGEVGGLNDFLFIVLQVPFQIFSSQFL